MTMSHWQQRGESVSQKAVKLTGGIYFWIFQEFSSPSTYPVGAVGEEENFLIFPKLGQTKFLLLERGIKRVGIRGIKTIQDWPNFSFEAVG